MTATPQQRLREIRDEAQTIAAKGILSADESASFEGLMTEAEGLKSQIKQLDRFGELNDFMGQSAGTPAFTAANGVEVSTKSAGETVIETSAGRSGGTAVKLMEQYGEGLMPAKTLAVIGTTDYRTSFKSYLQKGLNGLKSTELKTLQEGTDGEGGFLVPSDFLDRIIAKEPTPTRVAGRTTMLQTSRDTLVIPRVNYTSDDIYTTGIRSTWTGEIPASSSAMRVTDPVFGQSRIPVYTNMLSIPVTNDMIEDASFPLVSWLSGKFGETIDLLRDNMVLNGTGQGQPTGILLNPGGDTTQPATIAMGNPISGDGIVSLGFALPEQYDSNAAFVFSKTQTGPVVAKLKDTNGRYLWGSGLQDSGLAPDMHNRKLLGYDVIFSEYMPGPGANKFPMLFGDLSGYYFVNRIGFSVTVLRELYAETNQIMLLGRVRFGGMVAEAWKVKVGKQA